MVFWNPKIDNFLQRINSDGSLSEIKQIGLWDEDYYTQGPLELVQKDLSTVYVLYDTWNLIDGHGIGTIGWGSWLKPLSWSPPEIRIQDMLWDKKNNRLLGSQQKDLSFDSWNYTVVEIDPRTAKTTVLSTFDHVDVFVKKLLYDETKNRAYSIFQDNFLSSYMIVSSLDTGDWSKIPLKLENGTNIQVLDAYFDTPTGELYLVAEVSAAPWTVCWTKFSFQTKIVTILESLPLYLNKPVERAQGIQVDQSTGIVYSMIPATQSEPGMIFQWKKTTGEFISKQVINKIDYCFVKNCYLGGLFLLEN